MELETGPKEIYPTNDFFLNYMFNQPQHWETLRHMVNIFIEAYQNYAPHTALKTVTDEIRVTTQYKYYTSGQSLPKAQDLRLDTTKSITFMEMQNRITTNPPIEIRGREYFGLSLGHNNNKTVTQMWVLAKDTDILLQGNPFANYTLSDEKTGAKYPLESNLMAISLTRLSASIGEAAALAQFLLGKKIAPTTQRLVDITSNFNTSIEAMKIDKEASTHMTVIDKSRYEGREEGREEGIEAGQDLALARIIRTMLAKGMALVDIASTIGEPIEKLQALQV